MSVQISLAQLSFEFGNTEHNVKKVRKYIEEAAIIGSNLVLLPELWASGFDLRHWQRYATPINQGVFRHIQGLAEEYRIGIGCSLLENDNARGYNTFVLYDNDGALLAKYQKIHRFQLLNEHEYLGAGNSISVIDTIWGRVGLAVCYDLRFPELFRKLATAGVELVLLVAEWPLDRVAHWDVLLRARAIENQYFLAAVNKVGESNGVRLGGHSTILDAWGREISFSSNMEGLITGNVDLNTIKEARKKIPVFEDRRPDIYNQW